MLKYVPPLLEYVPPMLSMCLLQPPMQQAVCDRPAIGLPAHLSSLDRDAYLGDYVPLLPYSALALSDYIYWHSICSSVHWDFYTMVLRRQCDMLGAGPLSVQGVTATACACPCKCRHIHMIPHTWPHRYNEAHHTLALCIRRAVMSGS